MRLGILTGGGDCPGLNAVIRAAVMRTVRTYGSHMLGIENGWRGLFENRVRDLDLTAVSGILAWAFMRETHPRPGADGGSARATAGEAAKHVNGGMT